MTTKKTMMILMFLIGSLLLFAGLATANGKPGEAGETAEMMPHLPCLVLMPYTNTSSQPETYEVTAIDDCDGQDSFLYVGSVLWARIPDGGSVNIDSITIKPGKTLSVDCNGSGGGSCSYSLD